MKIENNIYNNDDFNFPYPKNRATNIESLQTTDGIIVEVEGIDGSGKSTLVKRVAEIINKKRDIVTINFIHSEYMKDILLRTKWENSDPYNFLFMYLTGLSYTYSNFIIPNLKSNKIVILDRYIYIRFF